MAVAGGRFVVNASVGSASVGNYNGREVMGWRYRSYGVGELFLKGRKGGRVGLRGRFNNGVRVLWEGDVVCNDLC